MSKPANPISGISFLIPAYNEELLLPACIASIHESLSQFGNLPYEIIVCDNNSDDQTATVAQAHTARVVFEPHNQISRARNAAAAAATHPWLVFVDADSHVTSELLRATIDAITSGEFAAGGAPVRFMNTRLRLLPSIVLNTWNFSSRFLRLAAGSYIFCDAQAWRDTGGFSTSVYAGEEINFSVSLKAWARKNSKRFIILHHTPVLTSARKLTWYSDLQLLTLLRLAIFPWLRYRKDACKFWYHRPNHS